MKPIVGSNVEDMRNKENKRLQNKLLRIVASDFLCWIPVCIMTFVHFAGIFHRSEKHRIIKGQIKIILFSRKRD